MQYSPGDPSYGSAIRGVATLGGGLHGGTLQFLTDSASGTLTERMTINSSGNVGIGATSPLAKLDVGGGGGQSGALISVRKSSAASNQGNSIEWGHNNQAGYGSTLGQDTGGGAPFICFNCEAGTTGNTYRTRGLPGSMIKGFAGSLYFNRVTSSNADDQSATNSMTIDSTGNVGIGTSNPQAKLHVHTPSYNYKDLILDSDTPSIRFADIASSELSYGIHADGGNLYFGSYAYANRYDAANSTNVITINQGNVGIGTTSPAEKVQIAGHLGLSAGGEIYRSIHYDDTVPGWRYLDTNVPAYALRTYGTNKLELAVFPEGTAGTAPAWSYTALGIDTSNGNVGIGTTSPIQALDFGGRLKNIRFEYAHLGETGSEAATLLGNNMRASTTINSQIEISTHTNDAAHGLRMLYNDGWRFISVPQSHGLAVGTALDPNTYTKMRITTAGNVGIGTASPGAKLDVIGTVRAAGSLVAESAIPEGGRVQIRNSSKTGATTLDWSIWNMTGGYGNGLAFWRYFADGTNAGPSLWLADNGNVGIGTTSPAFPLDVANTARVYSQLQISGGNSVGWPLLGFNTFYDGNGSGGFRSTYAGYPGMIELMQDNGRMAFSTNGSSVAANAAHSLTERMVISAEGNVGIGTIRPSARLQVGATASDGRANGIQLGDASSYKYTLYQ